MTYTQSNVAKVARFSTVRILGNLFEGEGTEGGYLDKDGNELQHLYVAVCGSDTRFVHLPPPAILCGVTDRTKILEVL